MPPAGGAARLGASVRPILTEGAARSYIRGMVVPALPLLVVGAAGLAVGWLGRGLAKRLSGTGAPEAGGDAGRSVKSERRTRTLAWCPTCEAHMAPGHRCHTRMGEPAETIARSP